jgi:hypothetical protein
MKRMVAMFDCKKNDHNTQCCVWPLIRKSNCLYNTTIMLFCLIVNDKWLPMSYTAWLSMLNTEFHSLSVFVALVHYLYYPCFKEAIPFITFFPRNVGYLWSERHHKLQMTATVKHFCCVHQPYDILRTSLF